ncbi:MAG: PIG-L family deacetylase [Candidatus Saccharimonadales bacterium]
MKYSLADIAHLGTIMGIWAHPDDETWTMGGILAAACQNGQKVVIITASRGEAGKTADESRWPSANLASIRTKELEASLSSLGLIEHHWLDCPDGKLAEAAEDPITEQIADIIRATDPNTIFSFAKDGITGHQDHKTIHQWTLRAAQLAGSSARLLGAVESSEKYSAVCQDCPKFVNDVYFKTLKPFTVPKSKTSLCFELPDEIKVKKMHSLKLQASQTAQFFANHQGQTFLNEQTACECFMNLEPLAAT